MWETQAWKLTTSKKVNLYFHLPEFHANKIVMWKCHIDASTKGRHDIILGRDLLNALVPDPKYYENIIIGGEGTYDECPATMVDLSNYDFTYITDKNLNQKNPLLTCTPTNALNERSQ